MVAPRSEVRLDVRGIEHGFRVLTRARASVPIRLEEAQAEGALAFTVRSRGEHDLTLINCKRREVIEQLRRAATSRAISRRRASTFDGSVSVRPTCTPVSA